MSGLFKSKKADQSTTPEFSTLYDPFQSTREATNSWLTSQVGKAGPTYTGERVAPMSDLEQKSLDVANEYAAQPTQGQSMTLAQDEIKKTLSGDYDPSTSPYYQAVKAEAERNLQKTNERIADQASGGRRYFSGARLKQQGEAATDVNIALNKELGSLSEKERQNRLAVIPQALAAEQQSQDAAAKKAQTLQVIGALPRELQQALYDAIYQEWTMANYDYPLNVAQIASGLSAREPTFVQSGYQGSQPSISSRIISLLNM